MKLKALYLIKIGSKLLMILLLHNDNDGNPDEIHAVGFPFPLYEVCDPLTWMGLPPKNKNHQHSSLRHRDRRLPIARLGVDRVSMMTITMRVTIHYPTVTRSISIPYFVEIPIANLALAAVVAQMVMEAAAKRRQ